MEGHINLIHLIKKRLDIKILCGLALGVSIIMAVVIYLGVYSQREELKKKMVSYGEGVKHLSYSGIKHPMSIGDSPSVERGLLEVKKTVKGLDIVICDFDGEIKFATDEGMIKRKATEFLHNKDAQMAFTALLETGEQSYERHFEEERDGKRYLVNLYGVLNEEGCSHCHGTSRKVLGGMIVRQSAEETYAVIASLRNRTILTGIIGIAVIIAMLYFLLARVVVRPAIEFSRKAEEMAGGDLTVEIDVRGDDEIASLGRSINSMAMNLKDMLTKVRAVTDSISNVTENIVTSSGRVLNGATLQHNAVEETVGLIKGMDSSISEVARSAEGLFTSAEDTSSAVAEIVASIGEVDESVKVFSESTTGAASSIDEMVTSIKQIAESLQHLSIASEQTASSLSEINTTVKEVEQSAIESVRLAEKVTVEASDKGMKAVSSAIEGMEDIKDSVGTLAEVINRLGKSSEEIGQIVNVIDDVADQTALLALNAAILAAQAGEHGKGFSVVAEEIKALAERTSVSTKEITGLISSVQAETRSTVEMAEKGIESVEKGMKLIKEVNGALKSILESSHASTEKSALIRRATTEEVTVIRQITDAIKNTDEQIALISKATQEQSKGSALITDAIEKIKDLSQQVKRAVEEQSGGSRQISHAVESITHQAEQIAKATALQKRQSGEMVQAIEGIKKITVELFSLANEMNATIKSLSEESRILISELQRFKV